MNSPLFRTALLLSTLGVMACASTDDGEPSPDARDEVALVDGKADNLFGECQQQKVLDLLNDPDVTADTLKEAGLHTRAANNIVETRNGEDGIAGTLDDEVFEDLSQVDDVYYVGRVAMSQLAEMVVDLCLAPVVGQNEIIFSPQPYEESHLVRVAELIDDARDSIDIAMYSFSDHRIMGALEDAVDRGVSIRMIFEPARDDRNAGGNTRSDQLEEIGIDVRYINKIMHHKYAIIDGPREVLSQTATDDGILVTGSGNWSNSAGTRYDENTVFTFGNAELNMRFQREFNHLWAHSRDFDNGAGHEFFETDSIDETMIPDDPTVDAVFTSDNFRTYVSSRYGETFSVVRGRNTVADAIVEYIDGAEESIWIASGHLRSRPISEALLRKADESPEVDIKVYLDGQEYVSEWAHNAEVRNQQECLEEAGDSEARQQDCLDKSYHYSFDVDRADNIDLRFKYYSYRWHYTYAEQMHHKYMIVDGVTVLSGSYNYSDNAEHNTMENLVVYHADGFPGIVEAYRENFLKIWDTGDGLYEPLMEQIETSSRVPLLFDSMALTWDEVRALKSAIAASCPDANSWEFRQAPERHTVCFVD